MSSTSEPLSLSRPAGLGREAKVIALVALAHFTSHIHIMLLPPILGQVKEAFGVSFTQVALAITAFNVASALLQTPAGFMVDRFGPRLMLTGGLLVGSAAIAAAALLPLAWSMEGPPAVAWSPRLVLLLAYAALPCTAFAFWALTWISKELPAMTTSLGLLGVPLVGVTSASLELGEPLTPTLLASAVCVVTGAALTFWRPAAKG
jgi:drug/metabolite transporter (DMT)-like permease